MHARTMPDRGRPAKRADRRAGVGVSRETLRLLADAEPREDVAKDILHIDDADETVERKTRGPQIFRDDFQRQVALRLSMLERRQRRFERLSVTRAGEKTGGAASHDILRKRREPLKEPVEVQTRLRADRQNVMT